MNKIQTVSKPSNILKGLYLSKLDIGAWNDAIGFGKDELSTIKAARHPQVSQVTGGMCRGPTRCAFATLSLFSSQLRENNLQNLSMSDEMHLKSETMVI